MKDEKKCKSKEGKKDKVRSRSPSPTTQRYEAVLATVEEMHDTSFRKPVAVTEGILGAFFKGQLDHPADGPVDADQVGAPYVLYLRKAIGEYKVRLVPIELLRVAFCRLLLVRAALHFASDGRAIFDYIRPLRDDFFNGALINRFYDSFSDLVIECKECKLHPKEVDLLMAMLALMNHDCPWVKDELGLLSTFSYFQANTTGCFRYNGVLDVFEAVDRMVRTVGPDLLLAPVNYRPSLNERHLGPLAAILYHHRIDGEEGPPAPCRPLPPLAQEKTPGAHRPHLVSSSS